jgi:uncharacterized damage-inducible protein DinB
MKRINLSYVSSGLLFLGVLLISAFVNNQPAAEKISDGHAAMIADWEWARDYTLAYIEAMPESGINLRPVDSVRSFSEQMLHLTSANVGFTAQVTGLPPTIEDVRGMEKNEDYKNKAALAEVVETGYNFVISSLRATSSEKMHEKITLFGQFEMTGMEAMHKAFIHQNHHRGQTAVYIRLAGGVPSQMKLF